MKTVQKQLNSKIKKKHLEKNKTNGDRIYKKQINVKNTAKIQT